MTPMDHYKEAETILAEIAEDTSSYEALSITVALAQIHATLATVPKQEFLAIERRSR